jgi:hypothetical protein
MQTFSIQSALFIVLTVCSLGLVGCGGNDNAGDAEEAPAVETPKVEAVVKTPIDKAAIKKPMPRPAAGAKTFDAGDLPSEAHMGAFCTYMSTMDRSKFKDVDPKDFQTVMMKDMLAQANSSGVAGFQAFSDKFTGFNPMERGSWVRQAITTYGLEESCRPKRPTPPGKKPVPAKK